MAARDALELFALSAIWGASFLFMRIAAPEFGPVPLIAVRVGVAALFMCAVLFVRRGFKRIDGHLIDVVVVGLLNTAIPFSLFAFAVLHVSAGFGAILNSTAPLFGAVITYFWLKDPLSPSRIAGLVVGFVGVIVLVWGTVSLTLSGATLAILAGLAASLLYGVSANYTKRRLAGVDPFMVVTGSLIAATLALLPVALFMLPPALPSLKSWASDAALGVLCTGIAYIFYFHLIHRVGPSKAMLSGYLIPVFGMLWGALFLGEAVTANMLMGCGVILVGTALATGFVKPAQFIGNTR